MFINRFKGHFQGRRPWVSRPLGTGCRGFTLIELLVCIAILAILASIILPVLARAKERGRSVACLNNVRQLSLACAIYTDENADHLPYNWGQSDIVKTVSRSRYYNWTSPMMNWELDSDNTNSAALTRGGIGPYVGAAKVYRCPADGVLSEIQQRVGWTERVRSFSMNAMVGDAGEYSRTGGNVNNPGYKQFFKLGQIPKPSNIFVFVDEHPDSINDGYFLNNQHSLRWHDLPASYHQGAANLSFADGHAEQHAWRFAGSKPPAKAYAAELPIRVPENEQADFQWLMQRTSIYE